MDVLRLGGSVGKERTASTSSRLSPAMEGTLERMATASAMSKRA